MSSTHSFAVRRRFDGVVHHVDGRALLGSRGPDLLESEDGGTSWRRVVTLPVGPRGVASRVAPLGRLWRAGVHHALPAGEDRIIAFGFGEIFTIDRRSQSIVARSSVVGSRPIHVCASGGVVYYGEYRSNPERSPVRVWRGGPAADRWEAVDRFDGVRHIHGVFRDPHEGCLWVATGDLNDECAVWRTDDGFGTRHRVFGGGQQRRVVQLLFRPEAVYFGSDAPDEPNHLYRYHRVDGTVERLQRVEGPVFHGFASPGGSLYFSTVCEPSRVNRNPDAVVWRSTDGASWKRFASFRKDVWPMKLFQYGQVKFPDGSGASGVVWMTPFATQGHGVSLEIEAP